MSFFSFFRHPSAAKVAKAQLDQAILNKLLSAELREHYAAMESMLTQRILRLQQEVKDLQSKES